MKKFILFLCCIIMMACDKEDEPEVKELITGFHLVDPSGNKLGKEGNPNEKDFTDKDLNVVVSPIPCADFLQVRMHATKSTKISIWLTHATLDPSLKNSPYYITSSQELGKKALELAQDMVVMGSASIQQDVSGVPPGPYRLYFKAGEMTAWKNIIIIR